MSATVLKITKGQINESKIRLIAGLVFLLAIIYILSGNVVIPVFLLLDFAFRSFNLGKYSLLGIVSEYLTQRLALPVKPIYYPPKRFAARIGLVFMITIILLHFLGITTILVSAVLALFAFLESFFGFCAGCHVYNFLLRFTRQL